MNTPDLYERRTDRSLDEPSRQPDHPDHPDHLDHSVELSGSEVSALAVHRDPSRRTQPAATASPGTESGNPVESKRTVAWVRPTDLPSFLGARPVARGIDLQAELTRRARRAPVNATKAGRRITRTAIARADDAATTTTADREGVEL